MVGQRIRDDVTVQTLVPGSYGQVGPTWLCRTPNGILFVLNPAHEVIEHPDGTITVTPSILATDHETHETWHGYLERGVWREV